MTNIELINAINNAIAEGRVVTSGGCRIFGAYPTRGINPGEWCVTAVYGNKDSTLIIPDGYGVKSFIPIESDMKMIRESSVSERLLPLF